MRRSVNNKDAVNGFILVTRLCLLSERKSGEALQAINTEISRFLKYNVWGTPMSREDTLRRNGNKTIWANVGTIVSVKHFERPISVQKYKGRLIFLGQMMRRSLSDERYFVQRGDA
eukprot:GHVN01076795.1.p2 GENE.GHVN01076795.1~~GHVN01076795.1.p2  ORF type:complete len:116 (+),score=10.36 GHVN01076795.1:261-608(+)